MPVLIALFIAAGLGIAARAAARGQGLISDHAYNNRYNDATAARDDRAG